MARLHLRKRRRVPGSGPLTEGSVPASAPAASRLFMLPVATCRWVLTDKTAPSSSRSRRRHARVLDAAKLDRHPPVSSTAIGASRARDRPQDASRALHARGHARPEQAGRSGCQISLELQGARLRCRWRTSSSPLPWAAANGDVGSQSSIRFWITLVVGGARHTDPASDPKTRIQQS